MWISLLRFLSFKEYLCHLNPIKTIFLFFKILIMLLLTIKPLLLDLFSGQHMILLVVVVVLLFGGKKIPELAKGLGKGIREFNDAKDGIKNEIENGTKEKEKIQAPSADATTKNA